MKFYLLFLCFIATHNLYSQETTEKLGGIKTDFVLNVDDQVVNVFDQQLVKKSIPILETYSSGDNSNRFAYNVDIVYLEFVTNEMYWTDYFKRNAFYVHVYLVDEKGATIFAWTTTCDRIRQEYTNEHNVFYSLSLEYAPLLALNRIKKVQMVRSNQPYY